MNVLMRKITVQLKKWKSDPNHRCLLIEGARQVGKTFSINQFAADNYQTDHIISINFEETPSLSTFFDGDIDASSLIARLRLYFKNRVVEKGKTLLFLDEVQKCPRAITALKPLSIDGTLDVIATGSLLGVAYSLVSSFPVGYVVRLTMHGLDFEEFLWARGLDESNLSRLQRAYESKIPLSDFEHALFMDEFLEYVVVGGMPSAVKVFIQTGDYDRVLKTQQGILEDYRNDIAKYASNSEKNRARECFESIPEQLSKDYKKFQYKHVSKNGRGSLYEGSIQWLIDAGIALKCHNLSSIQEPLMSYRLPEAFKLYMNDTGLLVSMLGAEAQIKILEKNLGIYNGAIYENVIADIFHKNGKRLFFFEKPGRLELDFILIHEHQLTAVEVKSADNTRSKSLKTALESHLVERGIKLSSLNLAVSNPVERYPLYMAIYL